MTKQATTIYLVRHGESESNKLGRIGGRSNLTEKGRRQAQKARDELKNINFDVVYSSDLERATHTAEILYGEPVPNNNKLKELRERFFGSLEDQPDELLHAGNAKKLKMSEEESGAFKHVPDMESDDELASRYVPALEKIAKNNPCKTILVGTHGSAIRTVIMKLSHLTYKDLPAGSFKNAGYAELQYDPGTGFKVIQISGVKL